MKTRLIRALSLLLTLMLILCAATTVYSEEAEPTPDPELPVTEEETVAEPAAPTPRAVGDTVTFGYCEQGYDPENKVRIYAPIEWTVLEVRADGSVLLISKYALDCLPFNKEKKTTEAPKAISAADTNTGTPGAGSEADATGGTGAEPEPQDIPTNWETCSLRAWLNEDFYNKAFKTAEKERILVSEVSADANPECATWQGNATQDKVYLLSYAELTKYFKDGDARLCVPTEYAVKGQGVYQDKDHTVDEAATCWWWLRTMGKDPEHATIVFLDGIVAYLGENVNLKNFGVRPVIAVRLP